MPIDESVIGILDPSKSAAEADKPAAERYEALARAREQAAGEVAEDAILEAMDDCWWAMTDAERQHASAPPPPDLHSVFLVKVQAPHEISTDIDLHLLYNEDRTVELLIPAGLDDRLDDALEDAPNKRLFCNAQIHKRRLLLLLHERPATDPEW